MRLREIEWKRTQNKVKRMDELKKKNMKIEDKCFEIREKKMMK